MYIIWCLRPTEVRRILCRDWLVGWWTEACIDLGL